MMFVKICLNFCQVLLFSEYFGEVSTSLHSKAYSGADEKDTRAILRESAGCWGWHFHSHEFC